MQPSSFKMYEKLEVVPITIAEAKEFCRKIHRHHPPPLSGKFAIAVADHRCNVRAVAVVSRPTARGSDDGFTAEITRLASDGARNACSMLYRACVRAAFAMGYRRVITYTLADESGASLRGAGFHMIGERKGRSWHCPSRPRIDKHPLQNKFAWEMEA